MKTEIGILGIGTYLPPTVRKNDWWPEHIVESWRADQQAKNLARAEREVTDPPTAGAKLTFESMQAFADDPFKGAVERRVMADGMTSSDMEFAAAEEAIRQAGVDRKDIDLLLVFSQLPDQLIISNATKLHHRLGLSPTCFSMGTDSACNAFMQQLSLARALIRTGRARCALLIQSAAVVHITPQADPSSAWFGDGATAAVVGPVSADRGILGESHKTDGSFHDALIVGTPGKRWYDGDPIILYSKDRAAARRMLMVIADNARDSVDEALAEAGLSHAQVDFYATHQSTRWFRSATQQYIGLPNARSYDSFDWTGSLAACNIPFMLGMGAREGLLRDGDVVALHSGGSGVITSGMVLRWGT